MAHAQGILTQPSLNRVQNWALSYFLEMERRVFIEDKEAELERHLLNVDPERWKRMQDEEEFARQLDELPVQNPRDLDRWVANLGQKKSMSVADVSDEPFWKASEGGDA
jgi:hypothetical protein